MNKKICVYTCITGNYDSLNEIKIFEKGVDYYCFTNNKQLKSSTWKIVYIDNDGLDNVRLARKIKILGHDIINEDYDIAIWMDGNFRIKRSITEFIKDYCDFKNYDFIAFKHSVRNCIYKEGLECIKVKKDSYDIIEKQLEFYKENNFPKEIGLVETGIFIKNLKSNKLKKVMIDWFDLIMKYSKRDQLSFNYSAYINKLNYKPIELNIYNNNWFEYIEHKSLPNMNEFRVYFGDEDVFDVNAIVDGYYNVSDEKYTTTIIAPKKCNKFKIELPKFAGIIWDNLEITAAGLISEEVFNFSEILDKKIFYNTSPVILAKGKFEKGIEINISIYMHLISNIEYLKIIKAINTDNNNLKIDIYNLKNENQKVNIDKLKIENQYTSVINSRGWKILEKLRSISKKIKK